MLRDVAPAFDATVLLYLYVCLDSLCIDNQMFHSGMLAAPYICPSTDQLNLWVTVGQTTLPDGRRQLRFMTDNRQTLSPNQTVALLVLLL